MKPAENGELWSLSARALAASVASGTSVHDAVESGWSRPAAAFESRVHAVAHAHVESRAAGV